MYLENTSSYMGFVYVGPPVHIGRYSQKKLLFRCACGQNKQMRICSITTGRSKTCGECNSIILDKHSKHGDFTYVGDSINIHPHSEKKLPFRCKCGNIKKIMMFQITTGHSKTCGECNKIKLNTNDKYGNFVYVGEPTHVHTGSHKQSLLLKCGCGRIKLLRARTAKKSKTCGECNNILLHNGSSYNGFEYVGKQINVGPWSKQKLPFKCKCGRIKSISICTITCGDTVSCCNCYKNILDWYFTNKETLRSLKGTIEPEKFPKGGVVPLETIKNVTHPFRATCPACKSEFRPRLNDIKRASSLTCGCVNKKISTPVKEICHFIKKHGFNVIPEYKIDTRFFDLYVPAKKLLIEFNGIRWHSKLESKKRDIDKYKLAVKGKYGFILIFEDEWKYKKKIIKKLLENKLGVLKPVSIRPGVCEIILISNFVSSPFYEEFHYVGKCSSSYNYGVYYKDKLIACMSFRRPSRRCSYDYEISRMVTNPEFRIHGIWAKILKLFILNTLPSSIVTYSDNRLFTGNVYKNMGFIYDGNVHSDYYWTKGDNRYHKSGLRKPPGCLITETRLRESEGFRKIWDLGKKRWVYRITRA